MNLTSSQQKSPYIQKIATPQTTSLNYDNSYSNRKSWKHQDDRFKHGPIIYIFAFILLLGIGFFLFFWLKELNSKVTIIFDSQGGTPIASIRYDGDDTISIPTNTTKRAYDFSGWYLDKNVYNKPLTVKDIPKMKGRVTVYAKWDLMTHNKSFSFNIDENDKSIRLTGFIDHTQKDILVPKTIEGYNVTSISPDVFRGSLIIENVDIQADIMIIEEESFAGCTSLVSIVLPQSVKTIERNAFSGSVNLTIIDGGDNVEHIYESAFANCLSLKTINLPKSILFVGSSIFYNTKISELSVPFLGESRVSKHNNHLGWIFGSNDHLSHSINVPITLKYLAITDQNVIESNALRALPHLETLHLSKNLHSIKDYALAGNSNLRIIDSIESSSKTLIYDESISLFNLPVTVKVIGDYAFEGFHSFDKIVIPTLIDSIGDAILRDSKNMKELVTPFFGEAYNSNEHVHLGRLFGASSYLEHKTMVPKELEKVFLTKSMIIGKYSLADIDSMIEFESSSDLTLVDDYAFYDSNNLRKVILSDKLSVIGNSAFENCENLLEFELPSLLRNIGNNAFLNCSKLVGLKIPAKVSQVGDNAFENCTSMEYLIVPAELNLFGVDSFKGCTNLVIYYGGINIPSRLQMEANNENITIYVRGEWELKGGIPTKI